MGGKGWKQKIIDDYMNKTGANYFVPAAFLGWLKDQPDHECYDVFFGMTDEAAAQAYREELVRKWVSGLRVVVRYDAPQQTNIGRIEVREYKVPLLHSPVDGRKDGGGYLHTDPADPKHMAEVVRQGAVALAAWLERYTGAANLLGVDLAPVAAMRAALDAAADRADPPVEEKAA